MKQNKAGNIKHAAGTLESYKPPPQDALELAVVMASASTGTRIIPTGQQQAINLSTQQSAIVSTGERQPTIPLDEQQATISNRPVHDAPPEERSSYSLTSMPPDGATEPLKNNPAISPRDNAAILANDGGYVVQVSAERSDDKAQSSFKTLQSRYPHVLGNRSPLIRRVELAWIPTEQNSPDIMLIETAHFRVHRPAAISRNGALIAGLPCVSWRVDLAILANSEVFEAKRC